MQDTIKQVRQGDNTSFIIEAPSATPDGSLVFSNKEQISIAEYEQEITKLIDEGAQEMIFNFSKLIFMNSAYIAMLITFGDALRKKGGQAKLVALDDKRIKLIEMVGVLSLFETYDTEEDALAKAS